MEIKYVIRRPMGEFMQMHFIGEVFCDTIQKANDLLYCFQGGYVVKVISNEDFLGETLEDALHSEYAKFRQDSTREMWRRRFCE